MVLVDWGTLLSRATLLYLAIMECDTGRLGRGWYRCVGILLILKIAKHGWKVPALTLLSPGKLLGSRFLHSFHLLSCTAGPVLFLYLVIHSDLRCADDHLFLFLSGNSAKVYQVFERKNMDIYSLQSHVFLIRVTILCKHPCPATNQLLC